MAPKKQKNEENAPFQRSAQGRTLFQSNAALSTNALAWRGVTDARIPLFIITPDTLPPVAVQAQSAALFVVSEQSKALGAQWAAEKGGTVPAVNPLHAPACVCCVPVQGLGRALAALVQERARGVCSFFTSVYVVCDPENIDNIHKSLEKDNIATSLCGFKNKTGSFSCY